MGCHSSRVATSPKSTQRVRVVVVGDPGSGKASLCRQFIKCTFASSQGQDGPFYTGTRTLLDVQGEAVEVTVVNERTASPDVFQSADAVLITVRADAPQPFAGVYQRMEALKCRYRPATGGKLVGGKGKRGRVAAPHALPTNSPRNRAFHMPSPGRLNTLRSMVSSRSSMDAAGAVSLDADGASSESRSHNGTYPPFSWSQREETLADVGASPAACVTSPLRARAPASFQSLALNTAPTGEAPFAKRASKRPRRQSVHEEDLPVAVAVTACDVIDTETYCAAHPGRRDLLRLMATNWATAHRSCVTFVSSKSGVGVYTAVSNLVAHVLSRRAVLQRGPVLDDLERRPAQVHSLR